jgi:hypothetical protein
MPRVVSGCGMRGESVASPGPWVVGSAYRPETFGEGEYGLGSDEKEETLEAEA